MGGGYSLLTNRNITQTNNQTLLNEFSKDLLANDRAITGVGNIEFTKQYSTPNLFAIARSDEGDRVYAWGSATDSGQLGIGRLGKPYVPSLVKGLPADAKIKFVSGGTDFTLIVLADNSIWATGKNDFGQFGNGENDPTTIINEFKEVHKPSGTITALAAGYNSVAAIIDSKLYTWGDNSCGQLGINKSVVDMAFANSPQEVTSISTSSTEKLGELKVSGNAFFISTLNTTDNTIKDLYAWGDNKGYQLGLETQQLYLSPTVSDYTFSGKLTGFYPFTEKVYFSTQDGSIHHFYGCGSTKYGALDDGSENGSSRMFEVNSIPAGAQIGNVWANAGLSLVVTTSGDIYSCGLDSDALATNDSYAFKKADVSGFTDFYGSSNLNSFSATLAIKDNQLYAWGDACEDYGISAHEKFSVPTLIYPFSTKRSTFKQIKTDNKLSPSVLADSIYNSTTGLNEKVFKEWIEPIDFPEGTTFSMDAAPTVNVANGQVELVALVASGSHLQPDGARTLGLFLPFVLTGFRLPYPDSNLIIKENQPWLKNFKYENIKAELGEGDTTSRENLEKIYNLDSFPPDVTFKINTPILTFDAGTRKGTYTANLVASNYYLNDTLHTDGKKFDIVLNDFVVNQDSTVTTRSDINTNIYNLTNIDKKLRPANVLDDEVFKDLFTTTGFADGNKFTSVTGGITGSEYHVTIKADKAYVDGLIVSRSFNLTIPGLIERPNSNPIAKVGRPWLKYQYNTVKAELGEGVATDLTKLMELYDFSSFPTGTTYTISNSGVTYDHTTRIGTYKADVTASKHYLDGNIETSVKKYTITMDGFSVEDDSDIAQKPDLDTKKYNLTNINNKLCPNGTLDKGIFKEIFNTTNLPTDATLSSNGGTVNGNVFNITITADKAWADGFVIGKPFTLAVNGLQLRPDSTVIAKTPSPDELDDIISKLKAGEVIDKDTLGKLIDTSYFPEDTVFIIDTVNPNKDNSTIEFTFTPDKVYKDGNVIANTDASKIAFDANVKFEFPVEPTTNNTGLIIGLSIGGILLLLIIIGLVIWYLKRRNKDDMDDNQSVLY